MKKFQHTVLYPLEQGLADFFCKGPHSRSLGFACHRIATAHLCHCSTKAAIFVQKQYKNVRLTAARRDSALSLIVH